MIRVNVEAGKSLRNVMGNKLKLAKLFIAHLVMVVIGYCAYAPIGYVGVTGSPAGSILSVYLGIFIFLFGLCIAIVAGIVGRGLYWTLVLSLFGGVALGLVVDLLFITPHEYGERGWAWAAGRYGAWRVLE